MSVGGAVDLTAGLDVLIDTMARRIARFLAEQLRGDGEQEGLIDQWQSPLGARRHCAAVRRRVEARPRLPGADIVGRRHFLTREALADELKRASERRTGRVRDDNDNDPVEALDRALSKLGGAKKGH